jgi:hypothetical protein
MEQFYDFTGNFLFDYLAGLLSSLFLLLLGLLLIFKPQRVINFYMYSMTKNDPSNAQYETYKKKYERKSFYFNLKLLGILFMILGFALCIHVVNNIIKWK